jgi:16S rRNA (adenine1518-N6/adenine1519-N6)-dimethyltransferase
VSLVSPIDDLPPLRDVIERHGLRAQKSLGQNFLLDLNLTLKIARQAGPLAGFHVLEIGPGPGGLTRAILAAGAEKVTVVERDSRCIPALEEIAENYPGRLEIIEGDALTMPYIPSVLGKRVRIISNLPYNVATPLLTGWLLNEPWPGWIETMTLMFQKEVAERICAKPGSKSYGRLSILSQWRTLPAIAMDIGPQAFSPPPKVTSSVVHFQPITPLPCDASTLESVTKAAFGQRRKMLRASLKPIAPGGDVAALLEQAEIDGERRAETLTIEEFVKLAGALKAQG